MNFDLMELRAEIDELRDYGLTEEDIEGYLDFFYESLCIELSEEV